MEQVKVVDRIAFLWLIQKFIDRNRNS